MHSSSSRATHFIQLVDETITAAQQERSAAAHARKDWLIEDCDLAITNLRAFRDQASSGHLPASNGAGLGITRALGEWGVSDSFYAAGKALEDFYRDEYGA